MNTKLNDCPLCRSSVTRQPQAGQDLLWDAIPFFELLEIAKSKIGDCADKSEQEIRRCAEQVVRSQICSCCSEEPTILKSIVEEFVKKLRAPS